MIRTLFSLCLVLATLVGAALVAEDQKPTLTESVASCDLDNGNQIAIRYLPVTASGKKQEFGGVIPYGTVWAPNNQAMVLFTSGTITIGGKELSAGAYTLYVIPNKNDWTLVVSKETDVKAKYDAAKDVVRAPMEVGSLPSPQPTLRVILGHTGPNHCSLRIYWQEKGGFAAFEGK